jgi:hypothetical protein
MTEKLVVPREEGEDGEERWVNMRSHRDRLKAGERRKLYEYADTFENKAAATTNLMLLRRIAAHLIEDWYLDIPHPRLLWKDGLPADYAHLEAFDALDTDVEEWILAEAKWWMTKISLNFGPTPDPDSPTKPSDG